ncbi:MAG: 16S rRNA (uracil(1498)-N(3))-methyltransferase [Desulfuromonadales bacterium]|nr:16S rRNA (uracil(1498)-N(3))-methyltransferase [Desulfuromonadales bacterium]
MLRIDRIPVLEEEMTFGADLAKTLNVWRARAGEIVTVVDREGGCYRARLTAINEEGGTLVPFHRYSQSVESPVDIEIYQALPEKERFELVLQKVTEVGVTRIVPFISERSTTLEQRESGQKKSHRWPDVVRRAARQCRRSLIPELYPVCNWDETLYKAQSADLKLILSDRLAPWGLREALGGTMPHRVAVLVGPEGGFSEEEIEDARGLGFLPVSMGPRVFRTETAAIVGVSLLQYALGDLG